MAGAGMIPRRPSWAWRLVRWTTVFLAASFLVTCLLWPDLGLLLFWGLFVPLAPLMFLVVPGLWRNVCPLAAVNQLPRGLGLKITRELPQRVQSFAPLVSAGIFLAIVPLRKVVLDGSGLALAAGLLTLFALALAGGLLFKGKSGWCTQFCPMLQVEKLYGLSPLVVLPNSHCNPCIGCSRNCHDLGPTTAVVADLHDGERQLAANRLMVAGAMPWVVTAFFTQPHLASVTPLALATLYVRFDFLVSAGVLTIMVLDRVLRIPKHKLVVLHAVVAINLYYFFVTPLTLARWGVDPVALAGTITGLGGSAVPVTQLVTGAALALITAVWLGRAWGRERAYLEPALAGAAGEPAIIPTRVLPAGVVTFAGGPSVPIQKGATLLDLAERHQVTINAGCRAGACGADPVRILGGAENLSPITATERATLATLGLGAGCRLACCARVEGAVEVSTSPDAVATPARPTADAESELPSFRILKNVREVVVIGGGPAGMTAALQVRKLSPEVRITLIGKEPYPFYNRMAIANLISESTSVSQLYMTSKDWARTNHIELVAGMTVSSIDRAEKVVMTTDGVIYDYDRLILATGAASHVPDIPGTDLPGVFVLRTLDDGIAVQQFVRHRRCRRAVVIGGGTLGVESAQGLAGLGLRVYVLHRHGWPLSRQLDRRAGLLVGSLLGDQKIDLMTNCTATRLEGQDVLSRVETTSGLRIAVNVCVVAAGIAPNVELARQCGLEVERAVVVDDGLRTSDPCILAVGDVAQHRGRNEGLWPVALEHGRVAAANALGADLSVQDQTSVIMPKVAGMEILSMGQLEATGPDETEVADGQPEPPRYRKLVLRDDRVVGVILVNHPELAEPVKAAVAARLDVGRYLDDLMAGDWSILETMTAAPEAALVGP